MRRGAKAAAILCLWLVAMQPRATQAGRPSGAGAGAGRGGSAGISATAARISSGAGRIGGGRPALPSNPSRGMNQFSQTQLARINQQLELDRLGLASQQNLEIVPPTPPDLHPGGPLRGYQILQLGRNHNNRLYVTGTIGGTKGLMMVDTGANNSALSNATYRGLLARNVHPLPRGVPSAMTINGTEIPVVQAPDYRVGGLNLGTVPMQLLPEAYLFDAGPSDPKGRAYDGLLGQNILHHYNAVVDCGKLALYLNVDPARKLNLGASFGRQGWTRVPMSAIGNDFTVPCTLNGHRYRLIVDTGAPFTSLNRQLLTSAGIESHDLSLRGGGLIGTAAQDVGMAETDHIQVGSYTATGMHMATTGQSLAAFEGRNRASADGPIIGLLGGDLLGNNQGVVDIGGQALYLKHPATASADKKR